MSFSHWSLRPALTALRETGDRPIAWASAGEESPPALGLFRLAMLALPGIGHAMSILARVAFGPKPRLFVLTERALLIFADEAGPDGTRVPMLERTVPVEHLSVRPGGWGVSFNLSFAPGTRPRSFAIDSTHSACAARLCQALGLLARSESPQPHDQPRAPSLAPAFAARGVMLGPFHDGPGLNAARGPFVS